ncbi:MAG: hypothetical protein HFJ55_04650 [Clostridia bacterium]|jgi:preprotein translocase subunit SecF|nr:hypothetical protein [Clostridia bacterium]
MEQVTGKNKKIYVIAIVALIIIAGIVITAVWGFNKELKYKQSQSINIYVEQKVEKNKIKDIVNQVLGKNNMVQTVEIYEDMVTIRAEEISEEQKNDIVNKVKEIYEFEQKAEDTNIKPISAVRIRDMYKQYILPFIITEMLVLAYMLVRYYNRDTLKVIVRTVLVPVIAELTLLSIIAITRIPVGRIVPILVILVYIGAILYVVKKEEIERPETEE